MLLTSIIIYLICGIAYLIYGIIKYQSFDLGGGFVSNWIAYPLGIMLWWYWLYRDIESI